MGNKRTQVQVLVVIVSILGLNSLAQAQHTGLFPNWQVRRERTPCAQEAPELKLYRANYYGVYPTCWRRFPPGWGCLSPEAPNAEQAFKELPRQKPIQDEEQDPLLKDPNLDTAPPIPDTPGLTDPQKLPTEGMPAPPPKPAVPETGTPGTGTSSRYPSTGRRLVTRAQPLLAVDDPTIAQNVASVAPSELEPTAATAAPTTVTNPGAGDVFTAPQPQRRGLFPWLFSSNRPRLFR